MANWRSRALPFLPALLALGLTSCTPWAANAPGAPQTTVFPASDVGRYIQGLYELIFLMAIVVFVGVEGFLVYAIIRFRRRAANQVPTQVHGNTRLEIAWTILPSIVLLVIAVPTIQTIFQQDAVPIGSNPIKVRVIGHQWWWEFRYPDLDANVVTANELHLPVGRTALLELESVDVVHSFWVPKVGGKMDVVPTRVNHLWFTPEETGEFYGQCVEFCGLQHANMRLRLFIDSAQDFDAWVARQRADATQPTGTQARQGAEIFQRNPCGGCHTIRGTNARGTTAPDLTHVGSRSTIAAGVLGNTYENLIHWISDPQGVKIGNKMPTLGLSNTDTALLAAYLQSLK